MIGYGSAHFPQPGNKPAQFDFVVIVDNLQNFFKQNLQKNPNHYAKLAKKIGAKGMIDLNRWGGKVFYHLVPFGWLKYGVISFEDFKKDLLKWKTFYLAWRVQKPIRFWCKDNEKVLNLCEELKSLIEQNRENMLKIALLRLVSQQPNQDRWKINFDELIETIVKISFEGTFRMVMWFEDPSKIQRIVKGSKENLKRIYAYHLKKLLGIENVNEEIEISSKQVQMLMKQLCKSQIRFSKCFCSDDVAEAIECFKKHFKMLNFRKSFVQTLKGSLSGNSKDLKAYALRKVKKGNSSISRLVKKFSRDS